MTVFTINELFAKRSELAGQILHMEKQVRQLREDLAHVEATIRILRPGIDMPKIIPKRVEYRPRHFKRGQLTRLILDYLRDHPGVDVSVADITPFAVGDRVVTSVEHQRVAVIVYQCLHKLAKRGTAIQTSAGVKGARWRLASEA
jgi:hypothetical protein